MANEIVNPQITDANSKILTFKEVCQAVAEGRKLQGMLTRRYTEEKCVNEVGVWFDFQYDEPGIGKPYINPTYYDYRIKPEDRYEPWTFDTCPRSGWTRIKICPTILIAINTITEGGTNGYTFDALLRDCEYSPNGIDGWRPAGRRIDGNR